MPASDATIKFYRQGATIKTSVTLPSHTPVPVDVFDVGQLATGDTVRVDSGPAQLSVLDVPGPGQLLLWNGATTSVGVISGSRLVPTNNPPQVYMDPFATVPMGTTLQVNAVTGRASAYLSQDRVDYDVSIPGQTPRLYVDGAGLFGRSDQRMSDLRDYGGSLAAAIAALPDDGGIVFVPRGTWVLTAGVVIEKPGVTLMGEGPASLIQAATPNAFDMITVDRPYFRLRDLTIDGAASTADPNGKSCVVVRGPSSSGHLVLDEYFEGVRITRAPRFGLHLQNAILFLAESCQFDSNRGTGVRVESPGTNPSGATTTQFLGCSFSQNGDRGCTANNVAVLTFMGCSFEGNQGGTGTYEGNALDAVSCVRIEVLSSYFKSPNAASPPGNFVALNSCLASLVDGCYFDGGPVTVKQPLRGVVFNNSAWSRLSSCTGYRLMDHLAWFDLFSTDRVEMGNSEVEADANDSIVRLFVQGPRFVGMSRRAIGVPASANQFLLPNNSGQATPGALAWVVNPDPGDSNLRVWSGSVWKNVPLT